MAFEKFTKAGRGYKPKVGIWSRGQIGFNQGAVEKFNLSEYKYIVFFFDRDSKRIGFQFTNKDEEEGANKIHIRNKSAVVSARSFLDFYEINYCKTKKYDMEWSDEEQMYVINLEQQEEKKPQEVA